MEKLVVNQENFVFFIVIRMIVFLGSAGEGVEVAMKTNR